jgi:molybdopterin converting factor small subunit
MMTITALLFASYADLLRRDTVELTLHPGATVRDALDRLRELPGGSALPPAPLVAINQEYSRTDAVLRAGDELAVIPPVAGG